MNRNQVIAFGLGMGVSIGLTSAVVYAMVIPMFGVALLGLLSGLAIMAIFWMYIGSLVWVYIDARHRVEAPDKVTFWVAIGFWPLGLFLWYRIRPELKDGGYFYRKATRQT